MAFLNAADGVGCSSRRNSVMRRDSIRCTVLERKEGCARNNHASNSSKTTPKLCFPHGMVIDDACSEEWLEESVQATRKSLPLNDKRPTVDRRFYCDTNRTVVCEPIEAIVGHALQMVDGNSDSEESSGSGPTNYSVYCNKYLRFLEYKTVGGELLPHRDGFKTCEDTGVKSTHTLLLFLSDCKVGGETLILDDSGGSSWSTETNLVLDVYESRDENLHDDNKNTTSQNETSSQMKFNRRRIRYTRPDTVDAALAKGARTKIFRLSDASLRGRGDDPRPHEGIGRPPPRHVSAGIQPSLGRIFLFPHHWPHAGAVCQSVPKIALRAELTIARA